MVKSMYSGVAGMKIHQTRMDVIGNNIANVNTYGFKGSTVAFSDVYYQTSTGAAAPSATQGGVNPSSVGSGAKVSSIDLQMAQSSFTTTSSSLDLAIAGEGFFMVQDADGNTFYTRAGNLKIDAAGNLVDSNGNFVLGISGDPLGRTPTDERIQIQLPSVNPSASEASEIINGKEFNFSTTNPTPDGNLSLNFTSSTMLPSGQPAVAEITTSGILITLNASETFTDLNDFNTKINAAITEANGGVEHPAGTFTVSHALVPDPFAGGITGAEISSSDFSVQLGGFTGFPATGLFARGGITVENVSSNFSASGNVAAPTISYSAATQAFTISMVVGGQTYSGTIDTNAAAAGSLKGTAPNDGEYITVSHPGFDQLGNLGMADPATTPFDPATGTGWDATLYANTPAPTVTATASQASGALGFSLKPIQLEGGTEGGPQGVEDLSSVAIGPDGTIEGMHSDLGLIQLGRITLATFANPQGLQQAGNTYFQETSNSGEAQFTTAGTGGSGALAAGSLEMSNVDLSKEFSDMIVTQRGFQANSRIITVTDEMLNELVNLKR